MVLLERESFKVILRDTKACLSACLELVKKYRDTPEAGRTHVVHAIPITFGYKAAVWAEELGRQVNRLESMKERIFMGEMAGAVGTLASQPEKGLATQKRMFEILDLKVPVMPGTLPVTIRRNLHRPSLFWLGLWAASIMKSSAFSIRKFWNWKNHSSWGRWGLPPCLIREIPQSLKMCWPFSGM